MSTASPANGTFDLDEVIDRIEGLLRAMQGLRTETSRLFAEHAFGRIPQALKNELMSQGTEDAIRDLEKTLDEWRGLKDMCEE